MTSVRFMPTGIPSVIVAILAPNLVKVTSPKYVILCGLTLAFIGSMIIPFAKTSVQYWSHLFPAFVMWVLMFNIFSADN